VIIIRCFALVHDLLFRPNNHRTMRTAFGALLVFLLWTRCLSAQTSELPLNPGDRISLSIGGVEPNEVPQISKVYTVSDGGTINLLHIKEVRAAGLKPSELQRAIENAYTSQEIYSNPTVTVSIDSTDTPRQVYVSGVVQPGSKAFKPGLTAMQAIMSGGGPSAYGDLRKTRIIRTNPDGTRKTIPVDLKKYSSDPSVDVPLQPEDQVIVPE
jgi:protein involved in polysaccharide export with SLBB domain